MLKQCTTEAEELSKSKHENTRTIQVADEKVIDLKLNLASMEKKRDAVCDIDDDGDGNALQITIHVTSVDHQLT